MLLVILTEKKLLERFKKKDCTKKNQNKCKVEKVIKRKGDKLYLKWKGHDNSFNTWIDEKFGLNIFQNQNLEKEE